MTQTHLMAAIKRKDVDKFCKLVDLPDYDIDLPVNGVTPLILAAKTGLRVITEKVISKGADLNMRDSEGRTALLHACQHGHSLVVRQLLAAGADTNTCSAHGDLPLHEAVTSGDLDTVKTLLAAGADVNRTNYISHHTPVMLALLNLNNDIVRILLSYGADLNVCVPGGDTALHYAVQVSPVSVISDLIYAGSHMDTLNSIGESPLIVAVYEGRLDATRHLMLSGCRPDIYDYFSPLCVACQIVKEDTVIIRYLLSEGYSVSKDESLKENLFFKLENEYPDLFKYIFEVRMVQPLSLREIARLRMRKLLGPNMSSQIVHLSVPEILRNWVARDVIY